LGHGSSSLDKRLASFGSRWLTEAKAKLPHGRWLPWLKMEFGWSQQSANNFIQVYKKFKLRKMGIYLTQVPTTSCGFQKGGIAVHLTKDL
jgi:Protein of unknown function (DUF3102)